MSTHDINRFSDLIISKLDTSELNSTYMITCKNGKKIKITHKIYVIITANIESEDLATQAKNVSEQLGYKVNPLEIESSLTKISNTIDSLKVSNNEKNIYLKTTIFSSHLVNSIASDLTYLFKPKVVITLVIFILTSLLIDFRYFHLTDKLVNSVYSIIIGYVIYVFSMIIHEFGHATACKFYGISPGDIGAGVYLIYPILYCDVSNSWHLKRSHRCVVDMSGIYFQSLFIVILTLILFFSGGLFATSVKYALIFLLGSLLINLNPIFRFDGYWLLSDAFGITNLSTQPKNLWKSMLNKLESKDGRKLAWGRGTSRFLYAYAFATWSFTGIFLIFLIRNTFNNAKFVVEQISIVYIQPFQTSLSHNISFVLSIASSVFIVVFGVFVIYRLFVSLIIRSSVLKIKRVKKPQKTKL